MLYFFEEFGFYVEIAGFKGVSFEQADVYLKGNRAVKLQNVWVQFFDSALIATCEHLYFAVLNAFYAFKNHVNVSKNLAVETLLYASSQRQIQKAIQLIGLKAGMSEMAVVVIGETVEQVNFVLNDLSVQLHANFCDDVLSLTQEKSALISQVFNFSPLMVEVAAKRKGSDLALVDLVIEKVALLAAVVV